VLRVMNPPILRPFPIGSLQWILAVGSPDASGVKDGLGEPTELFGGGCWTARGEEHERGRCDEAPASDLRCTPQPALPEMGRAGSARGEARLSCYSDCSNHFATAAVRVWSAWLR
jgi:hypothetical protein